MKITILEAVALILILVSFVKILYLALNKKAWWKLVRGFYRNPVLMTIVLIILSAIVLGYILAEITIVQLMAAFALSSLVFTIMFLQYPREIEEFAQKAYKKKITIAQVIFVIIWIFISLWTLYEIFSK